ncbi:HDIG domain-containing metalloprotein [Candidatus Karelsulcia muelleri]|uniref:HDIG domain-containing metalloprotein n=1 Tax=Candidatus Karelsulcia muelleri TaxID=336810 RepID=UPI0035C8D151
MKERFTKYIKNKLIIKKKLITLYKRFFFILKIIKFKINNLYIIFFFFLKKIYKLSIKEIRFYLLNFFKKEEQIILGLNFNKIKNIQNKKNHFLAKKIIIESIQRLATSITIENSISILNIDSLEMKKKIIGKNGINIRALETLTGVEIIIDDNPDYILISSFNPIRREIARLAISKLILDCIIYPSRIEEIVFLSEKEILKEIFYIGKKTIIDMGIRIIHPELIKIVGKMKYRSSYGQNLLQHSCEVANLSSILSSEIGLNIKFAKRAGLLHDIGKVSDFESEFSHAVLGMNWGKKYGEHPYICNAIGSHHDEIEMKSLLSPIIQISDTISSSRPGVRRNHYDSYLKRLNDLEILALNCNGVKKAFALQSGKELRVIVESETIDEKKIYKLSRDLIIQIKNKVNFPGEIKITVIREIKSLEF